MENKESKKGSTGKVIAGVAIGVAVGALVGVLFAPDKGSVTRKRIMRRGEEIAEEVDEKVKEAGSNLKSKAEGLRDDLGNFVHNGKTKVEDNLGRNKSTVKNENSGF